MPKTVPYTYHVRAFVYGYGRATGYEVQLLCVPPCNGHFTFPDVKEFDLSPALTLVEDTYSRHVLTTTVPITNQVSDENKCHGAVAMSIVAAISKSLEVDVKTGTIQSSYAEATLATSGLDESVDFNTAIPKWMEKPTKREDDSPILTYIVSWAAMYGGGRVDDGRTKVNSVPPSAAAGEKRVRDESAEAEAGAEAEAEAEAAVKVEAAVKAEGGAPLEP